MPMIEYGCPQCLKVEEHFHHRSDAPAPDCCGAPMRRLISRFGIVWTGPISKYNDPTKENHNQCEDGHFAWKVRSSRSGYPERVRITSISEQREYCRQEGLLMPSDCPANADISEDGRRLSSQGLPGAWV